MLLYGNYLVFDLMQLSILKHNFVHEYIFVYALLYVCVRIYHSNLSAEASLNIQFLIGSTHGQSLKFG